MGESTLEQSLLDGGMLEGAMLKPSTLGEPTKVTMRKYDEQGRADEETTHEDLCSVEIGATVTGEAQIKSVKVYAASAYPASVEALETFRSLQRALSPGPDLLDTLVNAVAWVDPDEPLSGDLPALAEALAAAYAVAKAGGGALEAVRTIQAASAHGPALLDALEGLVDWVDSHEALVGYCSALGPAYAAIDKARPGPS